MLPDNHMEVDYPFGIWDRRQIEYQKVRLSCPESGNVKGCSTIWPYIVLKTCKGKMFADLRDSLSWDDTLNLATFLGEQLHNFHILPYPSFNGLSLLVSKQGTEFPLVNGFVDDLAEKTSFPPELGTYIKTLNKKEDISSCLTKWGDPIPITLIDKVGEYIPDDFEKFFNIFEDDGSVAKPYTWIHSDVMDDNIQMKPSNLTSCSGENTSDASPVNNGCANGFNNSNESNSWRPCHIIDFSGLSLGHPICDLIPVYLDVFRGDSRLLKQFLESYKLPVVGRKSAENNRFRRASYLAILTLMIDHYSKTRMDGVTCKQVSLYPAR
ncbi:hypothetical protein ACH5RR_026915 [Cinchona calisaya]|uniref:Aminoglycoside phosphotransferase domain-containing protein n=1 Tax=Cinchona calisaya TaxID=153742 RepID=A0ABD2Z3Y4_9GENT